MCVSSYNEVGAIEQRYMVNSGVRGTKDKNLRSRCTVYSGLWALFELVLAPRWTYEDDRERTQKDPKGPRGRFKGPVTVTKWANRGKASF
jgi:hypothetical protein